MRVTSNTFPNSLVDQLSKLAGRQNQLQNQAATGQRITLPEDDPRGVQRVLDLQTEGSAIAQYQRNVATMGDVTKAGYQVLRGLKDISDRASVVATQAGGVNSPEQLAIYAGQIAGFIKEAVQLTQTRFQGDYLLGGTRTDTAPFAMTTDANGNVTAVTYQGNQSVIEREVAEGTTMAVQAIGANASGTGPRGVITDSRFGADFFNHLISLQNHLLAGDTAAIANTDRTALAHDEDNLVLHLGSNAATQARLEASAKLLASRGLTVETQVSREADADLSQTLVQLSQVQNSYRAALESGARLLNQSLLDYIR